MESFWNTFLVLLLPFQSPFPNIISPTFGNWFLSSRTHWHTRRSNTHGRGTPTFSWRITVTPRQFSFGGVGSQCFNLTLGFTLMQTHSERTIFLSFRFPAAMLARWSRIYMWARLSWCIRFLGGASETAIGVGARERYGAVGPEWWLLSPNIMFPRSRIVECVLQVCFVRKL